MSARDVQTPSVLVTHRTYNVVHVLVLVAGHSTQHIRICKLHKYANECSKTACRVRAEASTLEHALVQNSETHLFSEPPLLLVLGVQLEFGALQRLLELRGVLLEPEAGLFGERQFILQLLCISQYVQCSYEHVVCPSTVNGGVQTRMPQEPKMGHLTSLKCP